MSYSITDNCTGCTACKTVCPVEAISGNKGEKHKINEHLCVMCGVCGKVCAKDAILDTKGNVCERIKRSEWAKPVFDLGKCFSCENCISDCPAGCLEMVTPEGKNPNNGNLYSEYPSLSNPKKCISCGWCCDACGFDAIEMTVASVS